MSTKFNQMQKLQKTPKICKKGQKPLPPAAMDFTKWPVIAFVSWITTVVSDFSHLSGLIELRPTGNPNVKFGMITAEPFAISATLTHEPPAGRFEYELVLFQAGLPIQTVSTTFRYVGPLLPFSAGMFTWNIADGQHIVTSKLWS